VSGLVVVSVDPLAAAAIRLAGKLPGLRRVEVFGWPQIRWIKARIPRGGPPRYQIEAMPP
jgi:hypothetical protein